MCRHIRPRRCCVGCIAWFKRFYQDAPDPNRWRERFEEALTYWKKRGAK